MLDEIDQLILEYLEQGGSAITAKQRLESIINFLKDVSKENPKPQAYLN
jgi:hypothetical protein